MSFKRAVRELNSPKIAIQGVSGAGKTYSALRFARGYVGEKGRIAVIDTENGSASLYSNITDFDVLELQPRKRGDNISFWWLDFQSAIEEAVDNKYDILIIDSASHIWQAVLDFKARLDKQGGNSFVNWGEAGLQFGTVQNTILQSKIPVICCLRSKTEYVMEADNNGKITPKKLGLAPVTRGDSEYDFSLVFDVDRNHNATIAKSRCNVFDDTYCEIITENTGKTFKNWILGDKNEL